MPRQLPAAHPAAPFPARRGAGFQLPRDLAGRRGAPSRRQRARARHQPPVGRDGARARRRAPRGRARGIRISTRPSCRSACATCCSRASSTSACSARSAQGKISFYMRSLGEEAVSVAQGMALRPRRHAVPVLSQPGPVHGSRPAARRPHVPVALEHARHVQGPPAAGDVPLDGGPHLLDLGQPDDAVSAGGRLGHGRGDQGRGRHRRELDRRGLERRGRLPPRDAVRLRVPGAGDPQRRQQPVGDLDVPGLRRRRAALVRGARPGLRHGRHARGRQRFPRRVCGDAVGGGARAHRRRPDADRARHLSRRRALDQRRPVALPAEGRLREVAARRPGRAPQEPPDRARRVVGGAARGARARNSSSTWSRAGRRPCSTAR